MNLWLIVLAAAVVTIGSRVAAVALLPLPRGAAARVVNRLPAPLFAALAALSLVNSQAGPTDPRMLTAAGCALLASRWRSLLGTVAAGLGGWVLSTVVM